MRVWMRSTEEGKSTFEKNIKTTSLCANNAKPIGRAKGAIFMKETFHKNKQLKRLLFHSGLNKRGNASGLAIH